MDLSDQSNATAEQNLPSGELTRMIGHLTATASEDWTLVLEVCDRASASESNAKEAIRALRREFKYGYPPAQLSATRLWAIMLRNSSDTFISQSTSRKFLDTLKDLLQSSRTSPIVRERLLEVVAAAAYASGAKNDPKENRNGFAGLWRRVKPFDKPDEGVPFDTDDAMFNPPMSGRVSAYEVPMVQYQEATLLPEANNKPSSIPADVDVASVLISGAQPQQQLDIHPLDTHPLQSLSVAPLLSHRPLPLLPGALPAIPHQLPLATGFVSRTDPETLHDHGESRQPDIGAQVAPTSQHLQDPEDDQHHITSGGDSDTSDVDTLPPFELEDATTSPPPRYSSIFPAVVRRLSAWRRSMRQ